MRVPRLQKRAFVLPGHVRGDVESGLLLIVKIIAEVVHFGLELALFQNGLPCIISPECFNPCEHARCHKEDELPRTWSPVAINVVPLAQTARMHARA